MTTHPLFTVPSQTILAKTDFENLSPWLFPVLSWSGEDLGQVVEAKGYALPGDGGGELFKDVASEPSHGGKIQSADGAWWEIVPRNGQVSALSFGMVGDGTTDNRTNWETFRAYLASEEVTGYVPAGTYYMTGDATASPAAGPIRLRGDGTIVGDDTGDWLNTNGDVDIEGLAVRNFVNILDIEGAGDIRVTRCTMTASDYFIRGDVNADVMEITHNHFEGFTGGLTLETTTTINDRSVFAHNTIEDVERYVYRFRHAAPLYFHHNKISNIHCDSYTSTSAVARIIMRGSEACNFVHHNDIRDVVATDADSVLLYWSVGDAIITNNVFGKFDSGDDTYLVKEKGTGTGALVLKDNTFLGGTDAAEWSGVVYLLTDHTSKVTTHQITGNTFYVLKGGGLCEFFHNSSDDEPPGNVLVADNTIYEMNGPAFVSCVTSMVGVTIRGNRCFKHHNAGGYFLTGTNNLKAVCGVHQASAHAEVGDVLVENNDWTFSTDGESSAIDSGLFSFTGLSSAPTNGAYVEARNNRIEGAESLIRSLGSVGDLNAFVMDMRIVEGLNGDRIGGLTAAKALINLTETGGWTSSSGTWTAD